MIKKNIEINNFVPSLLADNLGSQYSKQVPASQKKEFGQFFTPTPIAQLMSSYSTFRGESVSILDPGCGTAVLSCWKIHRALPPYAKAKLTPEIILILPP